MMVGQMVMLRQESYGKESEKVADESGNGKKELNSISQNEDLQDYFKQL